MSGLDSHPVQSTPINKSTSGCKRHSILLGLVSGFMVGMLWWVGLMIAFGPSVEVITKNGHDIERTISVASRMVYAPLVAVPWAIAGLIVGAVSKFFRGYWVPVLAAVGTIAGGTYSLSNELFDGWLVLIMPFHCLLGTFWGMMAGVLCSLVQIMMQSGANQTAPPTPTPLLVEEAKPAKAMKPK